MADSNISKLGPAFYKSPKPQDVKRNMKKETFAGQRPSETGRQKKRPCKQGPKCFSERINSYEKLLTLIILTRFTECQI